MDDQKRITDGLEVIVATGQVIIAAFLGYGGYLLLAAIFN